MSQALKGLKRVSEEKYYLALVVGNLELPSSTEARSPDWIHQREGDGGRIDIAMWFDQRNMKSSAWNTEETQTPEHFYQGETRGRLRARTYYQLPGIRDLDTILSLRPVAWFSLGPHECTLVQLQILTGRRHQIRLHMAELGHPIVSCRSSLCLYSSYWTTYVLSCVVSQGRGYTLRSAEWEPNMGQAHVLTFLSDHHPRSLG